MEEVLETYAQPHDSSVRDLHGRAADQLLKETRVPIPATREHPRRVDYE